MLAILGRYVNINTERDRMIPLIENKIKAATSMYLCYKETNASSSSYIHTYLQKQNENKRYKKLKEMMKTKEGKKTITLLLRRKVGTFYREFCMNHNIFLKKIAFIRLVIV